MDHRADAGRRQTANEAGGADGRAALSTGSVLEFGGVCVETIPTPHDGADGVSLVVDDGISRVGILTDLGHVFPGLASLIGSLDGLLIESNFDPDMLSQGSYPESRKRRIRGPGGHLSNREAAEVVARGTTSRAEMALPRTPVRRKQPPRAGLGDASGGPGAGACKCTLPAATRPRTSWKWASTRTWRSPRRVAELAEDLLECRR